MARLALYRNAKFVSDHDLSASTLALGRHPENNVILEDPTLSRFHARIEKRADVHILIDLGGQNGLYVNGERISGEVPLTPGDRIGLGEYVGVYDHASAPDRVRQHEPRGPATVRQGASVADPAPQKSSTEHNLQDAEADGLDTQNAESLIIDIESEDSEPEAPAGSLEEPVLPVGKRKSDLRAQAASPAISASASAEELFPSADVESEDEKATLAAPPEQPLSGGALPTENSLDLHPNHPKVTTQGVFDESTTRLESEPPFRPVLVLFHEGKEASRYLIEDKTLIVGRAQEADIQIALLGLSRKHAKIMRRGDDVLVEDLGSQNGTWINHVRATGTQILKHGDLLNFYEYGLLYLARPETSASQAGAEKVQHTAEVEPAELAPSFPSSPLQGSSEAQDSSALDELAELLDEPSVQLEAVPSLQENLDLDEMAGASFGEGAMLGDVFGGSPRVEPVVEHKPAAARPQHTEEGKAFDSTFLRSLQEDSESLGLDFDTRFDVTAQQERPRDLSEQDDEQPQRIWPKAEELERALRYPKADEVVRIEVYFDKQLYTQVPLKQPVTRIGVDARCDLALPVECGLFPWHMTLINFGAATVAQRMGDDARVYLGEKELIQAVLKDGDELTLGRVRMVYRRR